MFDLARSHCTFIYHQTSFAQWQFWKAIIIVASFTCWWSSCLRIKWLQLFLYFNFLRMVLPRECYWLLGKYILDPIWIIYFELTIIHNNLLQSLFNCRNGTPFCTSSMMPYNSSWIKIMSSTLQTSLMLKKSCLCNVLQKLLKGASCDTHHYNKNFK